MSDVLKWSDSSLKARICEILWLSHSLSRVQLRKASYSNGLNHKIADHSFQTVHIFQISLSYGCIYKYTFEEEC